MNQLTEHIKFHLSNTEILPLDTELEQLKEDFSKIDTVENPFLQLWREQIYDPTTPPDIEDLLFAAQLYKNLTMVEFNKTDNKFYLIVREGINSTIIKGNIRDNNYFDIFTVEDYDVRSRTSNT